MASYFDNAHSLATPRYTLIIVFLASLILMLMMTVAASLQTPVWAVDSHVLGDRWFQATLLDAYLGFLTFYVWVAFKETSAGARVLWFILIMSLGNMAMAGYVLLQLWRWDVNDGVAGLLLRRPPPSAEE